MSGRRDYDSEEDDYDSVKESRRPTAANDDMDDDEDVEDARPAKSHKHRELEEEDDEEMDEEEQEPRSRSKRDDDDEDEDDDDDDEDENPRRRKRPRERRNQFVDIEAEVDEEEEDADEDDDDLNRENDFVIGNDDDELLPSALTDERHHRELDRERQQNMALDAETIAARYRDQYGRPQRSNLRENSTAIPKRLLLPSVQDPSIWGIKCKPGKEKEIVYAILKKLNEYKHTKTPLKIISVLERHELMAGNIYIEARRQADVLHAVNGINNLYVSQIFLVPIGEMPDLLQVKKKNELLPGAYVRFKRGKYVGDLAQVENVESSGQIIRIRAVPRIDYGAGDPNSIIQIDDGAGKRKRPSGQARPPQRLFSEMEAKKYHPKELSPPIRIGKRTTHTFMGEQYENGYWCKDVKLSALQVKDVDPKLDEVTRFAHGGGEDGEEHIDLHALSQSLKASTDSGSTYLPGDMVEVYHGEQAGIIGKVETVTGDIVSINVTVGKLKGSLVDVPFRGLRKKFAIGDHVKVTGGSKFRDEVGMIVKIVDDKVTFLSDTTTLEVTVFSKDLREASDSGDLGASKGKYDLWDLVSLDPTTVACVTKVDRESLQVLDQNGQMRTVMPSQITSKIQPKRFGAATDRNGSEIRVDDTVKEVAGGENRTGVILHLHRGFAFLHNRELQTQTGGVFVARTSNVATLIAKGGRVAAAGPDLTKMNPAVQRDKNQAMPPPTIPKVGGRDKTLAQTVTIRQGPYKGLMGIVRDATDTTARIELHTKAKVITIDKTKLSFKDSVSGRSMTYEEFVTPRGRGAGGAKPNFGSGTPGWSGSRTPSGGNAGWQGSRTPMAASGGSGGRTPAWAASGDGGRTPAWKTPSWNDGSRTNNPYNDGSRTANPYDGSRTSYGASSASSSSGAGNKTPAWNPGSRTPYMGSETTTASSSSTTTSMWDSGSKTPGRPSASEANATWNDNYGASARTPAAETPNFNLSAPTPGASGLSAPTPGAQSAPTPAPISAPTPRANAFSTPWDAPTPGPISAATPGGGRAGYYDAPTPGFNNPKTPGAAWGGNDNDNDNDNGGEDDGPRWTSPSPSP